MQPIYSLPSITLVLKYFPFTHPTLCVSTLIVNIYRLRSVIVSQNHKTRVLTYSTMRFNKAQMPPYAFFYISDIVDSLYTLIWTARTECMMVTIFTGTLSSVERHICYFYGLGLLVLYRREGKSHIISKKSHIIVTQHKWRERKDRTLRSVEARHSECVQSCMPNKNSEQLWFIVRWATSVVFTLIFMQVLYI